MEKYVSKHKEKITGYLSAFWKLKEKNCLLRMD